MTNVRNAVRLPDGRIDCEVQWADGNDWLPFAASAGDVEKHGRDLHQALESGRFGVVPAAPVDIAAVRLSRTAEVESERERRGYLPIIYAGATFDADAKAQRNIQIWQTQLATGASLPVGFVWRDYANADHPCDAAFLNGLGLAITVRGTMLYQAAWAHKAAIAAMQTPAAAIAYDVSAGWPV